MSNPNTLKTNSKKQIKKRLQVLIFILILITPFNTYLAAQAGLTGLVKGLLVLMALMMGAIIGLC